MEKTIWIKQSDRKGFALPLEFSEDILDVEKSKILNLYFQEMVNSLTRNKAEKEFIETIKNILRSEGYMVMQNISSSLPLSRNIHGPLPDMIMYSASELIKNNPDWPPNLATAMILCGNALEIVVNKKLIDKFNEIQRPDKAELVEKDKSLSLKDKLTWLLTDAFNQSLKKDNTLWMWFKDINKMRNEIVHCKKGSLEAIEIEAKANHGCKTKLDKTFVKDAIAYSEKILAFLENL